MYVSCKLRLPSTLSQLLIIWGSKEGSSLESQNGWGWKESLETLQFSPVHMGSPGTEHPGLCPVGSWISPRTETLRPVPVFKQSHCEEDFYCILCVLFAFWSNTFKQNYHKIFFNEKINLIHAQFQTMPGHPMFTTLCLNFLLIYNFWK